jgi:hypothetical protein
MAKMYLAHVEKKESNLNAKLSLKKEKDRLELPKFLSRQHINDYPCQEHEARAHLQDFFQKPLRVHTIKKITAIDKRSSNKAFI